MQALSIHKLATFHFFPAASTTSSGVGIVVESTIKQ